jgi:hypothetical protein
MSITDSYSLEDKKRLSRQAHKARLKADNSTPGRVPLYHDGLFSYLRWALGEFAPCRADDTPIERAEGINYWQYETNYGRYRPLSEVADFLQNLLGKKFIEAFKFEAGLVDYQYLADKIEEVVAELLKRGRPAPPSMARASKWLNEQIMQLKESRHTIVASLTVPPSVAAPIGLPSAMNSSPTNYLEIIHRVDDSSDTLIEDAVLVEEPTQFEQSTVLSPSERILGPGFTLDEADKLAFHIELIDENRRYCLGERKLGAIVGFCKALKEHDKLIGTIPKLTAIIGPRYGVNIQTRKSNTDIAQEYFRLTTKALKAHSTTT